MEIDHGQVVTKKILARREGKGREGKNKPESGRHPELSSEIEDRIKTILRVSSNQGWTTTKQVEKIIIKECSTDGHSMN